MRTINSKLFWSKKIYMCWIIEDEDWVRSSKWGCVLGSLLLFMYNNIIKAKSNIHLETLVLDWPISSNNRIMTQKHTSIMCQQYLKNKHSTRILTEMDWPAQSLDLNPIELLWEQLDHMVERKTWSNKSILWEMLQKAWGEISSCHLETLAARMPQVCQAVITAKGGSLYEGKVWRTYS